MIMARQTKIIEDHSVVELIVEHMDIIDWKLRVDENITI